MLAERPTGHPYQSWWPRPESATSLTKIYGCSFDYCRKPMQLCRSFNGLHKLTATYSFAWRGYAIYKEVVALSQQNSTHHRGVPTTPQYPPDGGPSAGRVLIWTPSQDGLPPSSHCSVYSSLPLNSGTGCLSFNIHSQINWITLTCLHFGTKEHFCHCRMSV